MRRAMTCITAILILGAASAFAWSQTMTGTSATPQGSMSVNHGTAAGNLVATNIVRPRFLFRGRFPFGYPYYDHTYRAPGSYVVAEKRGPEAAWSTFTMAYQVNDKTARLHEEAAQTAEANRELRRELTQLNVREKSLKGAVNRESDWCTQEELKAELSQTEGAILEAESSVRPVVIWAVAGPYDPAGLDNFLVRLQREVGPLHVHPAQ